MVEALLKAGANPNVAQKSGMTPLLDAINVGKPELVKLLIAHGANVNAATTKTKITPLMWAIGDGHPEIATMLLEAGADVQAVDDGRVLGVDVRGACRQRRDRQAAGCRAGLPVNETGADRAHALPYAALSGQDAFALFLLEQGADPNATLSGVTRAACRVRRRRPVRRRLAARAQRRRRTRRARRFNAGGVGGARGGGAGTRAADSARCSTRALASTSRSRRRRWRRATSAGRPRARSSRSRAAPAIFAARRRSGSPRSPPTAAAARSISAAATIGSSGCRRPPRCGTPATAVIEALLAAGADLKLTSDDGTTPLMVAAGPRPLHVQPEHQSRRPLAERRSRGHGAARRRRRHQSRSTKATSPRSTARRIAA